MVNKQKLAIGIAIALTLLIGSGATYYIAQDDDAYYCESRDIVMICEKLSSGLGTRCYFEDTYKICNEGWEKILDSYNLNEENRKVNKWECTPLECIGVK